MVFLNLVLDQLVNEASKVHPKRAQTSVDIMFSMLPNAVATTDCHFPEWLSGLA